MSSNKIMPIMIGVIVLLFLLSGTLFTVRQDQRAIVLRFGKIVTTSGQTKAIPPEASSLDEDAFDAKVFADAKVYQPGLHVKVPFLENVKRFSARLLTLDAKSSRILTAEQKYVIVDYYAKWRIDNIPLYYTRTGGDMQRASNLIQQKINDNLRAQFGLHTITEVVSAERNDIMSTLQQEASKSAATLGVTVIDVRVKRIDLPPAVSASVFQRMATEREQVASKHRANGQAAAEKIRAQADGNVRVLLAEAKATAAKIRAEGDATATKLYADAYSVDPGFYAFLRSLQAYTASFSSKQDIVVLNPRSQFFDYFNNASGKYTNISQ
ncbi:MAG: protein HflC [Gammaproteobacteria bacterium]|nr:protein HflC [Gammaproteobacteria bacterium]